MKLFLLLFESVDEEVKQYIFKFLDKNVTVHKKRYKDITYFAFSYQKIFYIMQYRNSIISYSYSRFYKFFKKFFSIKQSDFEEIIKEWVEKTLNTKVVSISTGNTRWGSTRWKKKGSTR